MSPLHGESRGFESLSEHMEETLVFKGEIVSVLRELARQDNTSVSEVIRKAISDRVYFTQKIAEGYDIILREQGSKVVYEDDIAVEIKKPETFINLS